MNDSDYPDCDWGILLHPRKAAFECAWEAFCDGCVPLGAVITEFSRKVVIHDRREDELYGAVLSRWCQIVPLGVFMGEYLYRTRYPRDIKKDSPHFVCKNLPVQVKDMHVCNRN